MFKDRLKTGVLTGSRIASSSPCLLLLFSRWHTHAIARAPLSCAASPSIKLVQISPDAIRDAAAQSVARAMPQRASVSSRTRTLQSPAATMSISPTPNRAISGR